MNTLKDPSLKITAADRCTTSGNSIRYEAKLINPQGNNSSGGHRNPLFRQKPFLAQGKQKNNIEKETNSSVYSHHQTTVEDYTGTKSNSFGVERNQKNKSKYDYLMYAQKQIQLEKQASKELPKYSSKELSKQHSKELSHKDSLPSPYKMTIQSEDSTPLINENKNLKNSLLQVQQQLQKQIEVNNIKEQQIFERNQVIEDLMIQIQKTRGVVMDYSKLQNAYNELLMQTQRLKDHHSQNSQIQCRYQQLVEHCSRLEQILNQKDQFLEETLYNKERQYNTAMMSKKGQVKSLEHRLEILERENTRLTRELDIYANQKGDETKINKFQELSLEFQNKMNALTDENIQLKNRIRQFQGTIQELKTQKTSLEKIIKAFEDRDFINTDSKLQSELNYYKEKLQQQQEENDLRISQYELQILKLENQLAQKRYEITGSLLDFADKEKLFDSMMTILAENEKLKNKTL